jgi:ABC-type antimicrobial peptide transport system permease subunit
LTDTLRPHQLALLALAGLTGIWLTLVLLAVDLTDRRREFLVLRAAGWSRRALRLLTLGERVGLGVPAAIGSALLAAALAEPVTGTSGELPAALAALAAGSVALWGALGPVPGAEAG